MYKKYTPEQALAAFWQKVDKSPHPQGCWLWTAAVDKDGYGFVKRRGRQDKAHRVSYELANGVHPREMFVLHSCDNPACVNPSHLRLGTPLDNMQDKHRKGRGRYGSGEAHSQCKFSDIQIAEIRRRYAAGGVYYWQLAEEYGTTKAYIGEIVRLEVRK